MNGYKSIAILLMLLLSATSWAGRIEKGYKALHVYDYFTAKKHFTKALKYNESPGAQGLAIIYYRDDNPFHSYDSALVYIERSIATFDMVKERKKLKYAKFGFTKDSLYAIRQDISTHFYKEAFETHSVLTLTQFIERHPWAQEVDEATQLRDSLAFFNAVEVNTSIAFKGFMDLYPNSQYYELARDNYYDVQFLESTTDGSISSFLQFIEENPSSPLRPEAEKKIFELATAENTSEVYEEFIRDYPDNPHVDKAWWRWYQLELSDYSTDVISFFLDSTEIPYQDELLEDRSLFDVMLLPFGKEGKFGYMRNTGRVQIAAEYDYGSFFQEGLAIVAKDEKFGFVNKRGGLQIPCQFESASDFVNGLSIVEKNGRFGMIDRNGAFVFKPMYEDLGLLSEGLSYAMVAERYGYYNLSGEMAIPHLFDDAYDFKDGVAKVEIGGNQGYIDTSGSFIIPAVHESIDWYQDTLLVFSDEGLYGIMNAQAQIFVEPQFEWINPLREGLAVAEIDDRVVYLDSVGTIVIDNGFEVYPNYQLKGEFRDGVAVIKKKDAYGRIDKQGKIITDAKFENLGIGKNVFPGKKEDQWGLFNEKGKTIVSVQYDGIFTVPNGSFIVNINDTLGVIDEVGNELVPRAFESIESIKDDLFLVGANGLYGVYRNEELIVPVKYNQIGLFSEDYLFLNKEGSLAYYDLENGKLVEVKE
ncbi:MAG: WG repeat-containing protein [bacterium]|nr:WG repeat-containing protein [bacterium]